MPLPMRQIFRLTLAPQRQIDVVQVNDALQLPPALTELGLQSSRPVLVLVGGASGISPEAMTRLQAFFVELVAPLAEDLGLCVVDGGTDAGIMQLMGRARTQIRATFPLVGVATVSTVMLPNLRPLSRDAAPLEPNHTHLILVPGKQWGDESPWISQVASELAQSQPAVTLLVNGGQITWLDATNSVKAGRPVVVVAGSGRTADTLAAMGRSHQPSETAAQLTTSGLLHVVDLNQDFAAIAAVLRALFTPMPPFR